MTALIISIEKMVDIMEIVKSLMDAYLFIKGVSETIKNEAKERKSWSLSMLLGTLGASLWGSVLTGKGDIQTGKRAIATSRYKVQLDQVRICNVASSFNWFWNRKILSKWT